MQGKDDAPHRKTTPDPRPAAAAAKASAEEEAPKVGINTDAPWICSGCYGVIPDQKLTKCPLGSCHTKRLMPEKTPTTRKNLIAKDALKIIDGGGGVVDMDKRKPEIEQWKKRGKTH